MTLNNQKNKFYSYLIILVALFILIFVTKGIYQTLQSTLDTNESYIKEKQSVEAEEKKYNDIKKKISNNKGDIQKQVKKFSIDFSEEKLLKYFYDYTERNYSLENEIKIKSISFNEAGDSDFGFKEGNVNVSMFFGNEAVMKDFLNFLVDKDSEYTFFLDTFSYSKFGEKDLDNQQAKESFTMTLNLKIYYK